MKRRGLAVNPKIFDHSILHQMRMFFTLIEAWNFDTWWKNTAQIARKRSLIEMNGGASIARSQYLGSRVSRCNTPCFRIQRMHEDIRNTS